MSDARRAALARLLADYEAKGWTGGVDQQIWWTLEDEGFVQYYFDKGALRLRLTPAGLAAARAAKDHPHG